MLEFYEKRKLKRLLYSKPSLVVLVFLGVLLSIPTWGAYQKVQATSEARLSVASELHLLRTREVELQAEIDRLATDRGIEEEIRRKYEVGRQGEQMIVIVGEEPHVPTPRPEPQEKTLFEKLRFW